MPQTDTLELELYIRPVVLNLQVPNINVMDHKMIKGMRIKIYILLHKKSLEHQS